MAGASELRAAGAAAAEAAGAAAAEAAGAAAAEAAGGPGAAPGGWDERQLEFVGMPLGPGRLLGVPGGGKTRCVVGRVLRLADSGEIGEGGFVVLAFSKLAVSDFLRKGGEARPGAFTPANVRTVHSLAGAVCSAFLGRAGAPSVSTVVNRARAELERRGEEEVRAALPALRGVSAVFVDEAQDLSAVQYEFCVALGARLRAPVCLVGDPDQSVYGFQGGSDRHLLDHPGFSVSLRVNYRSTPAICAVVQASGSGAPLESGLAGAGPGAAPEVVCCPMGRAAAEVAERAAAALGAGGTVAVIGPVRRSAERLGRVTSMGLSMVAAELHAAGVPFRVHYGEDGGDGVASRGPAQGPVGGDPCSPGAVHLLTVHASKGLEYDAVLLINYHHRAMGAAPREDELHGLRCLWYVGLSRARRSLAVFCDSAQPVWAGHAAIAPLTRAVGGPPPPPPPGPAAPRVRPLAYPWLRLLRDREAMGERLLTELEDAVGASLEEAEPDPHWALAPGPGGPLSPADAEAAAEAGAAAALALWGAGSPAGSPTSAGSPAGSPTSAGSPAATATIPARTRFGFRAPRAWPVDPDALSATVLEATGLATRWERDDPRRVDMGGPGGGDDGLPEEDRLATLYGIWAENTHAHHYRGGAPPALLRAEAMRGALLVPPKLAAGVREVWRALGLRHGEGMPWRAFDEGRRRLAGSHLAAAVAFLDEARPRPASGSIHVRCASRLHWWEPGPVAELVARARAEMLLPGGISDAAMWRLCLLTWQYENECGYRWAMDDGPVLRALRPHGERIASMARGEPPGLLPDVPLRLPLLPVTGAADAVDRAGRRILELEFCRSVGGEHALRAAGYAMMAGGREPHAWDVRVHNLRTGRAYAVRSRLADPAARYRAFRAVSEAASAPLRGARWLYDLETTGLDTASCGLLEVHMEEYSTGLVPVSTLVRQASVPPRVTEITGIRAGDTAGAPSEAEACRAFRDALRGCDRPALYAHNGNRFDHAIMRRLGALVPGAVLVDTMLLFPVAAMPPRAPGEKRGLAAVYRAVLGRPFSGEAHRAAADVRMMRDILDASGACAA